MVARGVEECVTIDNFPVHPRVCGAYVRVKSGRIDSPAAMNSWWLQHADPHLALLTNMERSPFAECITDHRDLEPLPVELASEGCWGENDESIHEDTNE
ncbi:hypothetical protein CDG81_13635 [Actinopolyspora erythraea]|uniref:DUF4913 domain-containing protein n=1 Tax=Actinopolyspora erythraea TaxID=414996 RepID=A0A099D3N6_9ACTN|nr:DUF4913 domain-containing protein [Actinopolyspora erythraea]ASU79156.1 hypothetical protein CDG81_13635 [Actinopolyspora erythraea]KGI80664.1 hypothetical protein IL38_16180 [Actinopolyspora erythraea]